MKCKLAFSCKYGTYTKGDEVTDKRVLTAYPNYFESEVEPVLETKPEPVKLETKPTPKKRTRKAKVD